MSLLHNPVAPPVAKRFLRRIDVWRGLSGMYRAQAGVFRVESEVDKSPPFLTPLAPKV